MKATNLLNSEAKVWLQKSLTSELTASNTYKHLANHMRFLGLFGFEKFFRAESEDELKHAQILTDFVNDLGDVANMPKVDAITEFPEDGEEALDIAYQMELDLLNQYKTFYNLIEEKDITIGQFLLQFIEIQRKAVGEYGDLLAKYDIAKRTGEILLFDSQIGG